MKKKLFIIAFTFVAGAIILLSFTNRADAPMSDAPTETNMHIEWTNDGEFNASTTNVDYIEINSIALDDPIYLYPEYGENVSCDKKIYYNLTTKFYFTINLKVGNPYTVDYEEQNLAPGPPNVEPPEFVYGFSLSYSQMEPPPNPK